MKKLAIPLPFKFAFTSLVILLLFYQVLPVNATTTYSIAQIELNSFSYPINQLNELSNIIKRAPVADLDFQLDATFAGSKPLDAIYLANLTITSTHFTTASQKNIVANSVSFDKIVLPNENSTYFAKIDLIEVNAAGTNTIATLNFTYQVGDLSVINIIEKIPAPNSIDFPVEEKIGISFSDNMNLASLNNFNIYLKKGGSFTNIEADLSYADSGRTLTLTPKTKLAYDTVYYLYLTENIKNVAGQSLAAFVWKFTTQSQDSAFILSRYPAADAINIPVNSQLTINFSKNMNSSTINANNIFLLKYGVSGSNIPLNLSYNTTTRTATLIPKSPLEFGTAYLILITENVTDISGNKLAANNWKFTTELKNELVFVESPLPNQVNFPIDGHIIIKFYENMLTSTLNTGNIFIRKAGTFNNIEVGLEYSPAGRTVTLIPKKILEFDTVYQIHVTNKVKNLTGLNLEATNIWKFTTEKAGSLKTLSSSPTNNQTNVPINTGIVVTFSSNIALSTINNNNIIVKDKSANTFVPVTYLYMNQDNKLIIKPLGQWFYNTIYTVFLASGLKDTNDNSLGTVSWDFTTELPPPPPPIFNKTPRITVNGHLLTSAHPPYVKDNWTFVPFRPLVEALGAQVGFDNSNPEKPIIWGQMPGTKIELYLDENAVYLNEKLIPMDSRPEITNGVTMVPLRFVAEVLGKQVHWDNQTNKIIIQ